MCNGRRRRREIFAIAWWDTNKPNAWRPLVLAVVLILSPARVIWSRLLLALPQWASWFSNNISVYVVAGSKDKLATHEMLLIAQEWGWMAGYSGRIYQNRMLIINIKLNAAERVLGVCCHRHFFIVGGLVFKLQTAFLSPIRIKILLVLVVHWWMVGWSSLWWIFICISYCVCDINSAQFCIFHFIRNKFAKIAQTTEQFGLLKYGFAVVLLMDSCGWRTTHESRVINKLGCVGGWVRGQGLEGLTYILQIVQQFISFARDSSTYWTNWMRPAICLRVISQH